MWSYRHSPRASLSANEGSAGRAYVGFVPSAPEGLEERGVCFFTRGRVVEEDEEAGAAALGEGWGGGCC